MNNFNQVVNQAAYNHEQNRALIDVYVYTALGCLREIENTRNANPLRATLYNVMTNNNWNNEFTLNVQLLAIEYLRMLLGTNDGNSNYWQNVQATAEMVVTHIVSYAAGLIYSELVRNGQAQNLPAQLCQNGAQAQNQWNDAWAKADFFVSRGGVVNIPNQNNNGFAMGGMGNNNGGYNNNSRGTSGLTVDMNAGSGMWGNASGGNNNNNSNKGNQVLDSRYSDVDAFAKNTTQHRQAMPDMSSCLSGFGLKDAEVAPAQEGFTKVPELADWRPSKGQRLLTAFHPARHEQFFANDNTNNVVQHIQERLDMDYNAHVVPSALAKMGVSPAQVSEVCKTLDTIADSVPVADVGEFDPLAKTTTNADFFTEANVLMTCSLEEMMYQAEISAISKAEGWVIPTIHTNVGYITEPYFDRITHKPFLHAIAASNDFDEAIVTLLKYKDVGVHPALYHACVRKLTDLCNRTLAQNLSVFDTIDNIIDDYNDLTEHIVETYGKDLLMKFHINQARVIRNQFLELEESFERISTENLIDLAEIREKSGIDPVITFINTKVSVTRLEVIAQNLCLELKPGHPALLKASVTPELHKVVKAVFDSLENLKDFHANYLTTRDGVLYQITQGWLPYANQEAAYIITQLN